MTLSIANRAGYQAYQKNKYETASPHKLIQLLYDAALSNILKAKQALGNKQLIVSHGHIMKAQDIVHELMACLNEEQGGEVATNLKLLYIYVIDMLVKANLRKQIDPLTEAETVIRNLKEAWEQIGREVSLGKV